jgi:hypothetical protein
MLVSLLCARADAHDKCRLHRPRGACREFGSSIRFRASSGRRQVPRQAIDRPEFWCNNFGGYIFSHSIPLGYGIPEVVHGKQWYRRGPFSLATSSSRPAAVNQSIQIWRLVVASLNDELSREGRRRTRDGGRTSSRDGGAARTPSGSAAAVRSRGAAGLRGAVHRSQESLGAQRYAVLREAARSRRISRPSNRAQHLRRHAVHVRFRQGPKRCG